MLVGNVSAATYSYNFNNYPDGAASFITAVGADLDLFIADCPTELDGKCLKVNPDGSAAGWEYGIFNEVANATNFTINYKFNSC
jgi:hypothetical protein